MSNCATAYLGHCLPLSTHFVYFHSFLGRSQHSIIATKVKATLTYMMFRALGKPLGRHCSLWRDGFNCHCHPSCRLHSQGAVNIIKISILDKVSKCLAGLSYDCVGGRKRGRTCTLCSHFLCHRNTKHIVKIVIVF